jgi:lipopolysaccharide heptosyltransferase II
MSWRVQKRELRRRAIQGSMAVIGLPFAILALTQRLLDSFSARRPVRRILIIRLDLLGDVVLSLPAVRSIRAAYPDAEIDMLVRPAAAAIVRNAPDVSNVIEFNPDEIRPSGNMFSAASWRRLWSMAWKLRSRRYDLSVGLFGVWASVFCVASGARRRIGYTVEGLPFAYNEGITGRRYAPVAHEREFCLGLAWAAGGVPKVAGPFLDVSSDMLEHAQALVESKVVRKEAAGITAGRANSSAAISRPVRIVAHFGSSSGIAKRWTAEGWSGLLERLESDGNQVVVVGSPDERSLAYEVVRHGGARPIILAGMTTMDELLGVLAGADVVIGGDSGPLHIAEALGRPVLAIHGPSDPRISGPGNPASSIVRLPIICSPCYDAKYAAECPLGHHRCMVDLTSDSVFRRANAMLTASA